MAKDYNKLLYGKLAQEHDDFIDELKTKPPEQIIEAVWDDKVNAAGSHSFGHIDIIALEILECFKVCDFTRKCAVLCGALIK